MDLRSDSTRTFLKPNVSTSSSHPTARLSTISSSQETPYYQAGMDRAGHTERLLFGSNLRGAAISDGSNFISLVQKLFSKSSPLHSIFNTKKLKVSYRTTFNMNSVIKANTKKILSGGGGGGEQCKEGMEL